MGQLIPALCKPIGAGDRFRVSLTYQMQLAPMYNPVYDGLSVNFESFFVPNRILDPQWREFWTGYNEYDQMTPVDVSPLRYSVRVVATDEGDGISSIPRSELNALGRGSLLDFLGYQCAFTYANGYPVNFNQSTVVSTPEINAYPVLGYSRIWDDWYRNERTQKARLYNWYNKPTGYASSRHIQSPLTYNLETDEWQQANTVGNGNIQPIYDLAFLAYRNYAKDRFTTALPEPVIGGDVHIPTNPDSPGLTQPGSLISSLNSLALGTIAQLKLALKEYQYRMKDTYNGNRYVESIQSHYGVRVPDSTLQRSLYLGSAQDYVNFGEVYQTSAGDGQGENGALGDYAGRGASNGSHFLFDETFYEPGFVYVIFSVSPKARYFQGIQRHLARYDRDDYFSPEYQNIGDDFIEVCELFNNGFDADMSSFNRDVFGYQSRWYDLKSNYDELHGDFAAVERSHFTSTEVNEGLMMSWTFARYFSDEPVLSSEFSQIPIINRPFVDTDVRNDNYFVDIAFQIDALRPILAVESF